MSDTDVEQPARQLCFPLRAVEAIAELVDIRLQIRGGDAKESPQQERLEVADHDMQPGQPLAGLRRRRHPGA